MPYTKHTWNAGKAGGTPITAVKLNEMEDGIAAAATTEGVAADVANPASTIGSALSDTIVTVGSDSFAVRQPQAPIVPAAPVTLESPYDVGGVGVHPDVINVPEGWGSDANGKSWPYWMAYTPYWRAKAEYENPCIQVSDDGLTWVTPPGLTNPIDAQPAGTALNSDPDMLIVGDTLYVYYRQHDPSTSTEQVMLRTSVDGVTFSAEQTVIDTAPTHPVNRVQVISPAVVHTGNEFVMYHSKDSVLMRRTSADGITWTDPAACTVHVPGGGSYYLSHVDAMYSTDGRFHLLMMTATKPNALFLAKSSDGTEFNMGATPLMLPEHYAEKWVYRTCGIHEMRNGKDFYRFWSSGKSYTVGDNAVDLAAEADGQGYMESYYIGFAEGYDPDDPYLPDRSSVYITDDVIARGSLRGVFVGASRLFGRVLTAGRAYVDRFYAVEAHVQALLVQGPLSKLDKLTSEWAARYGYTTDTPANAYLPPVVVTSDPSRTYAHGSTAAIDFINQASDNTKANPGNRWRWEERQDGKMALRSYNAATDTWTTVLTIAPTTGEMALSGTTGVIYPKVISATGNVTGNQMIALGDRISIRTGRAPANAADATGTVGDIWRDDNYIYMKTSTGWKRTALATW